jgi:hypothetical protein
VEKKKAAPCSAFQLTLVKRLKVGIEVEKEVILQMGHLIAASKSCRVAVKYFSAWKEKRNVPGVPTDQANVSRDHNVYRDSCLRPTHYRNGDKS